MSLITFIFPSAQAANSERREAARYYLASEFYPELVLFQNTDQTYGWVLIDSHREEISLYAVDLSDGVASIHFDPDDTHVVTFELQNPTQNSMMHALSLAMLGLGFYCLPTQSNKRDFY